MYQKLALQAHASQKVPSRRGQRGLGLLETVAALTIMAAGAAVVFPWVSQSLRALERSKEAERRAIATMQSVRWLDSIDPAVQPTGEQLFLSFRVRWVFKPEEPQAVMVTNGGGQSRVFTTTLYKGEVQLERTGGQAWFSYPHTLVGYTRSTARQANPFGG